MSRGPVEIRDAVPADAPALVAMWAGFGSFDRAGREKVSREEAARAVHRLQADPTERLLVAVLGDEPVGLTHLRRAPVSPISEEDAVHVGYLHVLSAYRRRGIGKQLLEAAADWAEEKDSKHIVASVAANSRDSHRFLARLGLAQVAVVRAASVAGLRSKLAPAPAPVKARAVRTNVVATRRLMRRTHATS